MSEPIYQMRPDSDLAEKLREDFSAKRVTEELLLAVQGMTSAIGVTISWKIENIEDKDVDQPSLSINLSRLATSAGAMLSGGKINPINQLRAQDPISLIKQYQKHNKE